MLRLIILSLALIFSACSSISNEPRYKINQSLSYLNPDADLYLYIDLSKDRSIYNAINLKYKIALSTVNQIYLSYSNNEKSIISVLNGNFPKNAFLGIYSNPNFESVGNLLTNPKWKLKDQEIYIVPNRAKDTIIISEKEYPEKNNKILSNKYIDEIKENEIILIFKNINNLLPKDFNKNIIPFSDGIVSISDEDYYNYNFKAQLETDNARVLYLVARKLIPNLLYSMANVKIKDQLKAKQIDENKVEIEFTAPKEDIQNLIGLMISNLEKEDVDF